MTGFAFVEATRVIASRIEKCWAAIVSLNTTGAFGPSGLLSARGPKEASAAAPATPAAAPRNRRRSTRSSSAFTASGSHERTHVWHIGALLRGRRGPPRRRALRRDGELATGRVRPGRRLSEARSVLALSLA